MGPHPVALGCCQWPQAGNVRQNFFASSFLPTISAVCCRSMVVKLLHEGLQWENCASVMCWMNCQQLASGGLGLGRSGLVMCYDL